MCSHRIFSVSVNCAIWGQHKVDTRYVHSRLTSVRGCFIGLCRAHTTVAILICVSALVTTPRRALLLNVQFSVVQVLGLRSVLKLDILRIDSSDRIGARRRLLASLRTSLHLHHLLTLNYVARCICTLDHLTLLVNSCKVWNRGVGRVGCGWEHSRRSSWLSLDIIGRWWHDFALLRLGGLTCVLHSWTRVLGLPLLRFLASWRGARLRKLRQIELHDVLYEVFHLILVL